MNPTVAIHTGDTIGRMAACIDAASVQTCVTSPPYWGLRDYGCDGQLGLERTPEEYVASMVAVFRGVRRILRDDGTLWLNIGDSYNAYNGNAGPSSGFSAGSAADTERPKLESGHGLRTKILKPKDLVGIPWRLAFALQADGWYLRQDIIWHKPNPMPESVTDRCTKSHEYLFLLTKNERYYFDADAIAEPSAEQYGVAKLTGQHKQAELGQNQTGTLGRNNAPRRKGGGASFGKQNHDATGTGQQSRTYDRPDYSTRNKRSVWSISTKSYSGAHFAVMPEALAEPCILAGTSERGCCPACGAGWVRVVERTPMVLDRSKRTHKLGRTRSSGTMVEPPSSVTTGWQPSCECDAVEPVPCVVFDPFTGSGTVGAVAVRLSRSFVGTELNPQYVRLAESRINEERIDAPGSIFADQELPEL